jgi:hypothetical protein
MGVLNRGILIFLSVKYLNFGIFTLFLSILKAF